MSKSDFKPIYERTLSEQAALLKPVVEKVQQKNLDAGLYNIYRDEHCTEKDMFVQAYSDRKELVKIDAKTGDTRFVKKL